MTRQSGFPFRPGCVWTYVFVRAPGRVPGWGKLICANYKCKRPADAIARGTGSVFFGMWRWESDSERCSCARRCFIPVDAPVSSRFYRSGGSISVLRAIDKAVLKNPCVPEQRLHACACQFNLPRRYAGIDGNSKAFSAFRQNLSPHPEDWHCACFRPVFWLAFFLHQRLPMRFFSHSGFLSVSSGLQQRGAAPACLPISFNPFGC